ncbi:hypothetical protein, partial [Microvirga vignae]|uniref:hypothetical protein n=1 Tax=Microvirga vignae TaxID=1225564 RepID=UPI000AB25ACB
ADAGGIVSDAVDRQCSTDVMLSLDRDPNKGTGAAARRWLTVDLTWFGRADIRDDERHPRSGDLVDDGVRDDAAKA